MSSSFAVATLLVGSVLSQAADPSSLEKLQGTWVGLPYPIAIRLEGAKGKVYWPTSKDLDKYLDAPTEIDVTQVAHGLPNSTIEFTLSKSEAMAANIAVTEPTEFHGLYRIFGDEVALLLQPKGTDFPDSVDLTEAAAEGTLAIRFKKIPPDHLAEFDRVQGVWRFDAEPGQGGFFNVDQLSMVIGPGFVMVKRRGEPRAYHARVSLDPEKRQATCRLYFEASEEPADYTLGYSYDDKDRLTLTWNESPFTLVRTTAEDLASRDPGKAALASLTGSWTAVRGWARRRGKDVPRREVDERWVFAGDKLSVEADGEKTEYTVRTMLLSNGAADPALIGLMRDNPKKIVRYGRFEVADELLRIRLHPSIAPDEPPTPVEKSESSLPTTLYEFRRTPDADPR